MFIYVVVCLSTSFLWPNNTPVFWLDYVLFIHLSIGGHLGCFHLWVVRCHAAVNVLVQVSCGHRFRFLLDIHLGVELLAYMVPVSF